MNHYSLKQQLAGIYNRFSARGRQPVIGITANYADQTCKLAEGYYKQISEAGGVPLVIPPLTDSEALLSTLSHIDGLLLSGGADINPLYAGEQPSPRLGGINSERDLPELLITRLAFNRQLPILGICRGVQTMAVALGGKVAQDISDTQQVKHSQDADRSDATHTVSVDNESILSELYHDCFMANEGKQAVLYVNSFHHQAVSEPGPHFRVTARATDGIIEVIESSEQKPLLGVQWHPECMGEEGLPLFRWLVAEARAYREARQLHDRILTLDTHCDTPMFFPQNIDFGTRDERILVSLPRMQEGGLDATIMVAYIPQTMQESAFDYANGIFDKIGSIADEHSGQLALARTPDELLQNKRAGRKSIMFGIENGKALEGNLGNVQHFAGRGVVYITLCHNGDNDLCDSCRGNNTHGGVSPFGEQVIGEMNRLGLMVDLSHAADKSFYDALEMSRTPIVCSHSSCRALCNHPRNLTDEQMRALAKRGGVMQVTLYPGFLRKDGKATILDAISHLRHAIQVMGVEHVGLGTDFDGDGGVPGLADASELIQFTRQLLSRHYSEDDIQLIWGGNFLRVMSLVQQQRQS